MVVSNIFYFYPYLGKIPILTNVFGMGWNHQLVIRFWVGGAYPQGEHASALAADP